MILLFTHIFFRRGYFAGREEKLLQKPAGREKAGITM